VQALVESVASADGKSIRSAIPMFPLLPELEGQRQAILDSDIAHPDGINDDL